MIKRQKIRKIIDFNGKIGSKTLIVLNSDIIVALTETVDMKKHFFLPLPPYSPDLNPIEQAWAILKKKVTDLLREVPTIFECLERFFKTK